MSDAPTKTELLARLSAARAAWERAFGTLTREQLLLPDAIGFWSTKDLQDHTTSNNRWMAVQLRALVRGELPTAEDVYGHPQTPPPDTALADQEQRNARWQSIDRERPLDETLIAAPLWAAALAEPSWSLRSIIASSADKHYEAHNADLRVADERGHYGKQD